MPAFINRAALDRLRGRAQIVEVLGPNTFRDFHLPGAVNIPLAELDRRAPAELDRRRPVVVYCQDLA